MSRILITRSIIFCSIEGNFISFKALLLGTTVTVLAAVIHRDWFKLCRISRLRKSISKCTRSSSKLIAPVIEYPCVGTPNAWLFNQWCDLPIQFSIRCTWVSQELSHFIGLSPTRSKQAVGAYFSLTRRLFLLSSTRYGTVSAWIVGCFK